MIELIWESGKTIFGWISEMKKNKREINQNTSQFLLEISELFDDTVKKLARNEYPHDNCTQMSILCDNLISTLTGKMDEETIQKLHSDLDLSSKLERLYAEREDPNTLKRLKECKGMFAALGQVIKVK
jgi:hypothetical protein